MIEGSDAAANSKADSFVVTKPATGSVAVADVTASLGVVRVTETSGNLASLVIQGLGGDDSVSVNVAGTTLISVPILFDGGTGSNGLNVSGTPSAEVSVDVFTPTGKGEGSLVYGGATRMTLSFTHLERVTDSVPATSLVVVGNDADNSINYSGGLVSVDDSQALSFSNKTALTINALGGDDIISIGGATAPAGLTGITVNGGGPGASDRLIIDGTAGSDVFNFKPASATSGKVTMGNEFIVFPAEEFTAIDGGPGISPGEPVILVGPAVIVGPVGAAITFTGIEKTTLNGLAGDDTFRIGANTGNVELIGGEGADTVDFSASTVGVIVELDKTGRAQRVSTGDEFVTFGDLLEGFAGSAQNDVIRVIAQPFARTIDGGPEASKPTGDTLIVDALEGVPNVNFTSEDDGSATVFGFPAINFTDIETANTVNTAGGAAGGGGTGSVLNDSSFTPRVDYPVVKGPRAVQIGDVNGDGFQDMFITHQAKGKVSVMLGHGDGTFDIPVVSNTGLRRPQAVALGDFDGDGDLDAAVTNGRNRSITILQHTLGGVFTTSSTLPLGQRALNVVAGDVNGDGDLDLAVANNRRGSLDILLGAGGLSFGGATEFSSGGRDARDLALVDVDHDGKLDVLVANRRSNTVGVLKGTGAGGFGTAATFAVGHRPLSLVTGDFNQDGDVDVALATGNYDLLKVLLGDGTGTFNRQLQTLTPKGSNAQSIGVGDFNFDGKLDLAISTRTSNKLIFLLGSNNGTFLAPIDVKIGDVARRSPQAVAIGDLNGDGASDVAVAGLNSNTISVLLRNV